MHVSILTIGNCTRGVGSTSIALNLAWMLAHRNISVLACDLDPHADLTMALIAADNLTPLWYENAPDQPMRTIGECLQRTGDAAENWGMLPCAVDEFLALIPSDPVLARIESQLRNRKPHGDVPPSHSEFVQMGGRIWSALQSAARSVEAEVIVIDAPPNLGYWAQMAMTIADHILAPVEMDLRSVSALHFLGPSLREWQATWNWGACHDDLPSGMPVGGAKLLGYVAQALSLWHGQPRRPTGDWGRLVPKEFASSCLNQPIESVPETLAQDVNCLGVLQYYRTLTVISEEVHKPVFNLTAADGVAGSLAALATESRSEFSQLADVVWGRIIGEANYKFTLQQAVAK